MDKGENTKFAVIKTGGKQYKVHEGDTLKVEKLSGAKDKIVFDEILMVNDGENIKVGGPKVEGASVEATLKSEGKAKKIDVIKYKSKSRYHKKRGHRQPFSEVQITSIK